ncbi:hypothetical protein U1Q18_011973, partial [Sarracenia purpurea var. burkii]
AVLVKSQKITGDFGEGFSPVKPRTGEEDETAKLVPEVAGKRLVLTARKNRAQSNGEFASQLERISELQAD